MAANSAPRIIQYRISAVAALRTLAPVLDAAEILTKQVEDSLRDICDNAIRPRNLPCGSLIRYGYPELQHLVNSASREFLQLTKGCELPLPLHSAFVALHCSMRRQAMRLHSSRWPRYREDRYGCRRLNTAHVAAVRRAMDELLAELPIFFATLGAARAIGGLGQSAVLRLEGGEAADLVKAPIIRLRHLSKRLEVELAGSVWPFSRRKCSRLREAAAELCVILRELLRSEILASPVPGFPTRIKLALIELLHGTSSRMECLERRSKAPLPCIVPTLAVRLALLRRAGGGARASRPVNIY